MAKLEKRIDYLIKQGYSRRDIDVLSRNGVGKHMLWFLKEINNLKGINIHSKETIEKIKLSNEHIESKGKNNFNSLNEAYDSAILERHNKNLSMKKSIYLFKDGHSIVLLSPKDLHMEGIAMSNCVKNYESRIDSKETAILALREPKGNTVVHFEISKNGMISQNFEKANMPVRNSYWKYIYEFLKNNSKNIDSSKHFGFSWKNSVYSNVSSTWISAECIIPKRIVKGITSNGNLEDYIDSYETIKKFVVKIPNKPINESSKNNFIKKLKEAKDEMSKAFENIISSVEITDGENLFASDEIKEKIFGKNNYLMKGSDYNILDMTMFGGENEPPEVMEPVEDMVANNGEDEAEEEGGDVGLVAQARREPRNQAQRNIIRDVAALGVDVGETLVEGNVENRNVDRDVGEEVGQVLENRNRGFAAIDVVAQENQAVVQVDERINQLYGGIDEGVGEANIYGG